MAGKSTEDEDTEEGAGDRWTRKRTSRPPIRCGAELGTAPLRSVGRYLQDWLKFVGTLNQRVGGCLC